MDTKGITDMIVLEEVGVGLGKNSIQVILAGITEVVMVGLDQVQTPVLIETELDALHVGNMIKDCPSSQVEKEPEQIQEMYNMDEEQTTLNVFGKRYIWQS